VTRRPLSGAGTIALAVFPIALWLLLSPPGGADARESEPGPSDPPKVENVPQERLERWRSMSPEERDRIRERYLRWKELSPEKQERILERNRRWRELPEEQRSYLKDRRELLKDAGPEEREVVDKFFARMRSLPHKSRHHLKRKIWGWRSLSPEEREKEMLSWPFYRELSAPERDTLRWFLFAGPGDRHGYGDRGPRE